MLNFKNTLLFFISVTVIVIAIDLIIPVSALIYVGIFIVLSLIIIWGSKTIQSDFFIKSLCSGDRNKNEIAITFDDGPDAQVTTMILDVLKEHNIKATFFIIGKKAEKHPDIIKRIDKEGHIIGNHSYTHHFFFDLFSRSEIIKELQKTDDIIFNITGKRMSLFRPPYGVTNPPVAKAIKYMQYISIGWSLKSNDTIIENESKLLKRIQGKLQNGDVILFHDNKPWNAKVLGNLFIYLKQKNYKVIPLNKLLNINVYVF